MKQSILVLLLTVLFNIVSYSQNTEDIPQIHADPADTYDKISFLDETARIDSFLVSVLNYPGSKALIELHFSKSVTPEKNVSRLRKIFNYIKRRGLAQDRIVFAVTKDDMKEQTWLWVVPPEAKLPAFANQPIVWIDGENFQKRIKTIFSK